MSTTSQLLTQVRKMIPPISPSFHKGQTGRIAVVGGSAEYSGAPYYAAMSSALCGCDMVHVICEPNCAGVIKTYTPDLMVHPFLHDYKQSTPGFGFKGGRSNYREDIMDAVTPFLDRVNVLIIGPGLGRDPLLQKTICSLIEEARRRNMPLVLDADGLYLIQTHPQVIQGYKKAVLTPNVVEFARLCQVMNVDPRSSSSDGELPVERLAKAFGGVTIMQKGLYDVISNGLEVIQVDIRGGLKRCGGQGDCLAGMIGTFFCWKDAYEAGLWKHDNSLNGLNLHILAVFGAANCTRLASRITFQEKGRSMQTSDLLTNIGAAFKQLFESDEDIGPKKL